MPTAQPVDRDWLDLDCLAVVEKTSEDGARPIESALQLGEERDSCSRTGAQTIRLLFDNPQQLRGVRLRFEESAIQRTQEFVLQWSPDAGRTFREIVRQQWNFSPPETVREMEDYGVDLSYRARTEYHA